MRAPGYFQGLGKPTETRFPQRLALLFCLGIAAAAPTWATADEPTFQALNPRGNPPDVRLVPLTSRLQDLDGKTVFVIHAWPANVPSGFEAVVERLISELKARYPKVNIVTRYKDARPTPRTNRNCGHR
jgi:hypothetical protein